MTWLHTQPFLCILSALSSLRAAAATRKKSTERHIVIPFSCYHSCTIQPCWILMDLCWACGFNPPHALKRDMQYEGPQASLHTYLSCLVARGRLVLMFEAHTALWLRNVAQG